MKLIPTFFIKNKGLFLSSRLAFQLSFLLSLVLAGIASPLWAGELTQEMIEVRIKPPLRVLPRLPDVPAWPLKHDFDTQADGGPYGYVFESVDLAPLPGFDGTPLNLLVAIDRKGTFIGVEVISQHEPMFRGGIGEAPLHQFVTQYASRNLTDQIIVASAGNRVGPKQTNKGQVVLDGVAQATASIRIVNQSVLTAALSVARARLGFSAQSTAVPPATPDMARYEKLDFQGLLEKGLIGHMRLSNAQAEALFAGSSAAGLDGDARDKPDGTFVELYLAYLNSPTTGRAILGDARYAEVMKRNYANRHLWWVGVTGRYPLYDERFVPASVPPRLSLRQDGLPYELRDLDFRDPDYNPPGIPGAPDISSSLVMYSITEGGIDPGRPLSLDLNIIREHGSVMRETTQKTATLDFTPASHLFVYPPRPVPEWLESWRQRIPELSIIGAALAVLCGVLTAQRWSAIHPGRLRLIRLGFLAFTLAYIGWHAQGQLSIVQVNGLLRALLAGQGLSSFLYDPVTLLLIAFTVVSFFIWHLLWLALPLWCHAGIRRPGRPRLASAQTAPCRADCPAHRRAAPCHPGRHHGGGLHRPAGGGYPGRDRALQDRHHHGLRPDLALPQLRRPAAPGRRLLLQGLLSLPVPTRRRHVAGRQTAPPRLASPAQRMRHPLPDLQASLRLRRH